MGYVKRQLGRAQRELQMLKHHAHVVCLLSHLRHLNSYAAFPPADHDSAEVLLATALSIIPPAHSIPSKDLTMVRLSSFAAWFKSAFQCLTYDPDDGDYLSFPDPVEDWLMRAMENYMCHSPAQRVILFLLSARSLGWPTRLVMNFDTISTKPEKSLSGKLSEILGTISKKAKTDEQEDKNVPQLDGMIDIQEEKPQNKKESVGNSRQKDSGKRTSAKIKEKESSKSKETLQETLKRLKEERESSKSEESIQEKSKEPLQETLKRLREERDSSKSKEKQLPTKNKEREPSTSSKEKTKSTKESVSKEEKKSSNKGKDSKNERSRSHSSSKHSPQNSSKSKSSSSSAKDTKEENKSSNNDK